MNVLQYQDIARSYAGTDDPIEQIALAVCHVYGLTVDEVDDMKKANDGRPYYGDEEPLPLLWFLMVPEVYVPLALLGCAVVALVY